MLIFDVIGPSISQFLTTINIEIRFSKFLIFKADLQVFNNYQHINPFLQIPNFKEQQAHSP